VEASEETGAENDVTDETKKDDKVITAKDLVISSSEVNEERVALEKLQYVLLRGPKRTIKGWLFNVGFALG
jgi:hypothetical protein